jgi:predicted dehydrogenase
MRRQATRREFLVTTGALGAAALAARGQAPAPPTSPNEAITLGFIGVGGMGSGLLDIFKGMPDVRVAALCDLDDGHLARAKEAAGGSPETCKDFRKILERKDIDAVVVATPDHWHAIPTILACQAGKDVYCEKPLTFSVEEGQRVVAAAAKHQRVTQMGNLIHATENYHRMAEIVQSGVLGRITKVRIWMSPTVNDLGNPPDAEPPAGFDYDTWLGPAPKRPYNPNRSHFNWRFSWDYGGGWLSDFVCHLLDTVHWGLKVDAPEKVTMAGGRYVLTDNTDTPDTFEMVAHYGGEQPFQLVWSQQAGSPYGFEDRRSGVMFLGSKATLHGHYNDFKVIPNEGTEIGLPEPSLPRSPGHHREWLDAIRTRQPTSCNFAYGQGLSTVGHLGNIALRTGQTIQWDAQAGRITNSDAANALLRRAEYRAPWGLPEV